MAGLMLKKVQKVYPNGVHAVKPFDLEIKDKEFIVFVGPYGCGKSTILRMIAGLEDISSGDLYIDDKRVNDVEPKDREIAMVFQNYALYPEMTVYDNMAFGLKLLDIPKEDIECQIREAAQILEIDHLLNHKSMELSDEQSLYVAIGRAMIRKPKVYLMDEPLFNLDSRLRVHMREKLIKLHQRLGCTVIYVTEDPQEAMELGSRVVVMQDGVIQQVDTPEELYCHPCNMYVADYVGSPQLSNFDSEM